MRFALRALSLIPACVFLLSCTTVPTASKPAHDNIRIGVYLPMTGTNAHYGKWEWEGIKTANEMKPSVYGKKIDLVLVDTEGDKSRSEQAVRRLVEKEKVAGILGEATSANTMAGNSVSEAAGIPSVSPTSTNPLSTQGKKHAFRVAAIDPLQGTVAARFAAEHLKAATAAVLVDTSQDYSVGIANFFVREFTENKERKIVSTAYFQSGDKDYSGQLSSIRALNPDIIFAPGYAKEIALLVKQARTMGIEVPIISSDGVRKDSFMEVGGSAVEGVYLIGHFHERAMLTDRTRQFLNALKQNRREDMTGFEALGADAYFFLVEAMERAGSLDGAKISEALAATKDFRGVSGIIARMERGSPIKSMDIIMVKNARFSYVTSVLPTGSQ